jgi:hypothetical protein
MAAGKYRTRITKNTKVLQQIRKELPEREQELVVRMAIDLEHEFALNAPRDTTAMAESVYTQTSWGTFKNGSPTTVASVEARAKALNPDAEMSPSPTPGKGKFSVAYVKPIVRYFVWQEFGSAKMPGRNTMAKARAVVQRKLKSEYKKLFEDVLIKGKK